MHRKNIPVTTCTNGSYTQTFKQLLKKKMGVESWSVL